MATDWGSSLVSAGGDIAGSVVTGAFNASQAAKSRHWQEKMYDQRHQREVNDLRAAGLNPILSAMNGGGSVPGGSTATMPDLGGSVSKGISTALAVKVANQELAIKDKENQDKALDLEAKKRMYEWLEKNPQYKDLFLGGLMSRTAGLPSVAGPLMGANSGWLKGKVTDAVTSLYDWWFGGKADHLAGRDLTRLPPRPAGPMSAAEVKRRFENAKGGENR